MDLVFSFVSRNYKRGRPFLEIGLGLFDRCGIENTKTLTVSDEPNHIGIPRRFFRAAYDLQVTCRVWAGYNVLADTIAMRQTRTILLAS
jgi:hypothetical protein